MYVFSNGAIATSALPESVTGRFGELVWVKQRGFPYWPAYVYDPSELSKTLCKQLKVTRDVTTFSQKFFAVFYYGWASAGSWCKIKHGDATAFSAGLPKHGDAEKIAKRLREQFTNALAIAQAESEREPDERVAWNHDHIREGMRLMVIRAAESEGGAAAAGGAASAGAGAEREGAVQSADGATVTMRYDDGGEQAIDIRLSKYRVTDFDESSGEDEDADSKNGGSGSDCAWQQEAGRAAERSHGREGVAHDGPRQGTGVAAQRQRR